MTSLTLLIRRPKTYILEPAGNRQIKESNRNPSINQLDNTTSVSKNLAFEVSNFPSWKSPNEIVPYDTYIIFEENLGAILFAKNISKNINTFWSLEA